MKLKYRFRIQPVLVGPVRCFQLRVGLPDDRDVDCIPAHRTAFARCLPLQPAHTAIFDVHLELTRLLVWIDERRPVSFAKAAKS